jgi:hypothetical protein
MAATQYTVTVNMDHVPTHVAVYDQPEFTGGAAGTVSVVPTRVSEWTAARIFVLVTSTAPGVVRLRVY